MPYLIPGSDSYGGIDPSVQIESPSGAWIFARIRGAGLSVFHDTPAAALLHCDAPTGAAINSVSGSPPTSSAGNIQNFSTLGLISYDFEALGFSIGSKAGSDISPAATSSQTFSDTPGIGPFSIDVAATFPAPGTLFKDYNDGHNLEDADGGQIYMLKFSDADGILYVLVIGGVSNVITADKTLPEAPGWTLAMNGALIKVFTVFIPAAPGPCPATCQTNLSDASPPAPEGVNVRWQHGAPYISPNNAQESIRDISAYVPKATAADYGVVLLGAPSAAQIDVNGIPVSNDFTVFVNQSFEVNATQLWP
jgi:hypothetical protein